MTRRAIPPSVCSPGSLSTPVVLLQRYPYRDQGAFSRPALYLQVAAEQRDPLLHAGEPDPLAGTFRAAHLPPVETFSVIPHLKLDLLSHKVQVYMDPCSIGVFAHVRQRLLRDPVERRLDGGR